MDIIQEVSQNFIDSSYDVNTNRAFPDARDGLKPGMRACLWSMYTKGHTSDKPHVKSAKIDGEVAASLWPHGTQAIYETFARMSQPFTNNVPEVDFHGANGNVILGGGAIAADRYSEARLSSVAEKYMLAGCNKNAVDLQLNFSEDEWWPMVLPSIFPRLLVNGSQGIGVSIANSWCLHNLSETISVIDKYMSSGEVDCDNYLPDWPCGGTIVNRDELHKINETGKGKIVTEAKYEIVGREIRFTEFPFQVYIEPLVEDIKKCIDEDKVHNVAEVFNKSDKNRILLTVTCTSVTKVKDMLNELLEFTPLRSQFNVNQMAIVGKTPKLLTLRDMCDIYVTHNLSCIKREYEYDLGKTNERIEVLEGLAKALGDIDNVIKVIKDSDSSASAAKRLTKLYGFCQSQVSAILGMRLSRLAHMEVSSVLNELEEKRKLAKQLNKVIGSESEQKKELRKRLKKLDKEFGGPRRTKVIQKDVASKRAVTKKVKAVESIVMDIDDIGYVRNIPASQYRSNKRYVPAKMTTNDKLIMFTNHGRYFRIAPKDVKQCAVSDKGTAIGSIVELEQNERVVLIEPTCGDDKVITFVSKDGKVKRTMKSAYAGSTRNLRGMVAMRTDVDVTISDEPGGVIVIRSNDRKIAFDANSVSESGKTSKGVAGISLRGSDEVIRLVICDSKSYNGIMQTRGGRGVALR